MAKKNTVDQPEVLRLTANIHQVLMQKDSITLTVKVQPTGKEVLIPTGEVYLDITKVQKELDFKKAKAEKPSKTEKVDF